MLEEAAQVAQIVVGLSVVISLVFVGVELRQSSRTTRAAIYQNFMDQFARNSAALTADPSFAALLYEANKETRTLSGADRLRLRTYYQNVFMVAQNQHAQWRAGYFPNFRATAFPVLRDALEAAFVKAEWPWLTERLDPAFVGYLKGEGAPMSSTARMSAG
jgi:hypothetical protein